MPLLGKTVQEVLMARDTTSSFLSTSVMSSIENISVDSNRKNRIFGMIVEVHLTLSLTPGKLQNLHHLSWEMHKAPCVLFWN